jgi:glucose/arabinose dehydrogenase
VATSYVIQPMRNQLLCLAATLITTTATHAGIGSVVVSQGYERPLWVGAPDKNPDRLWIMEQAGKVWEVQPSKGTQDRKLIFDIVSIVSRKGNEEGLLGLAFAPDFEKSGRFYLNFVDRQKFTRIVRLTASGPNKDKVDPDNMEVLFTFKQPYENHNGGWLDFGPDGMLYIGTGDGGAGFDPQRHGQALDTYLGKILRIDVSPATGYEVPKDNPFIGKTGQVGEIWMYGMRNPWRCSFDRETGDLWIGDVGQNAWEEIDFVAKGKSKGMNGGWSLIEGDHPVPNQGAAASAIPNYLPPIYEYKHGGGSRDGLSVTGGYVYRGPIKELQGRYVFGDYVSKRVWSFVQKDGKMTDFKDLTDELQPEGGKLGSISSFGEDRQGNLYIVDHGGAVLKVVEK